MKLYYTLSSCFVDIAKLIIKFFWKWKRLRIGKTSLKNNKFWEFSTYSKVKQMVRHWHKDRQIDQWNIVRIEIDLHIYVLSVCYWLLQSHGTRHISFSGLRCQVIKRHFLGTAAKIGAPDSCKNSPPGDTVALELGWGRLQRWRPPVSVPESVLTGSWMCVLI